MGAPEIVTNNGPIQDTSPVGRRPQGDEYVQLPERFSADENQTSVGTVAASDADGNTLTYSITAGAAGVFTIDSGTGVISQDGTLDFETTPQYVLTVQVDDNAGGISTGTITVDVNDVNEAPVAIDNTFTVNENAAASVLGSVTATDVDVTADTLTYSITAGDPGGQLSALRPVRAVHARQARPGNVAGAAGVVGGVDGDLPARWVYG